jgi:hypothetical protein
VKPLGRFVVVTLAAALAATGCSSGQQPTTNPTVASSNTTTGATTSSSGRPSASPSTSAPELVEFSTDGAGPYQLGLTLTALKAKPGLDEVTTGGACPNNTFARGVGVWHDVRMSFRQDGKLYLLVNRSEAIPTPSGAWLGTTLDDLKRIYTGLTTQELTHGTAKAFLVQTLSGGGIMFELDPGQKVLSMAAADAFYLRNTFNSGSEYC